MHSTIGVKREWAVSLSRRKKRLSSMLKKVKGIVHARRKLESKVLLSLPWPCVLACYLFASLYWQKQLRDAGTRASAARAIVPPAASIM